MAEQRSQTEAGSRARLSTTAGRLSRYVPLAVGTAYLACSLTLPVGTVTAPDIGFFPVLVGILFVGSALVSLLTERRQSPRAALSDEDLEAEDLEVGDAAWKVLALSGLVVLYIALSVYIGHIVAATLFCWGSLRLVRQRPWWLQGIISVAIGAGSFFLFRDLLNVPLSPFGMF